MSLAGPMLFDPRGFWGDEDVKLLDWTAVGVYLKLLSAQWEEGSIPEDPIRLRAILAGGLRSPVDGTLLEQVLVFFEPAEEGRLANPRLAAEREEWISKKEDLRGKRSEAGIKSGEARRRKRDKGRNKCSTCVEQIPNESGTEGEQKRTPFPSSSLSDSSSSPDLEEQIHVGNPRTGLPTNGSVQEQIPGTDPTPPKKPPWATRAEIDWRVGQTWESLITRRAKYYGRKGFTMPPGRPPTLTPEIREDIIRSLRVHDCDLMAAEARDEWVRDSKTRAAGEGMYLTRWNLGIREGAEGENGQRATPYLEPWRPWKIRKGRDPVDEFAQVYFEKRAAAEAAGAVE